MSVMKHREDTDVRKDTGHRKESQRASENIEKMLQEIAAKVDRLSVMVERIAAANFLLETDKEWFSAGEVAAVFDMASFSVREWRRLGLNGSLKRETGHEDPMEWKISRAEIMRIINEGLRGNEGLYSVMGEDLLARAKADRLNK